MVRALTKRDFISKAVKVHGNKFDYSKVYYENSYTEVCIICPSHGEFWQRPKDHIYDKHGCQSCGGTKLKSKDQFIQDATKVHGDRFDYSKVEYKNNKTNVIIICSIHGEFMGRVTRQSEILAEKNFLAESLAENFSLAESLAEKNFPFFFGKIFFV